MRIVIDISQAQYAGTGVARYVNELIPHIIDRARSDDTITLFYNSRHVRYAELGLAKKLAQQRKERPYRVVTSRLPEKVLHVVWNRLHMFPIELWVGKHDIFFYSDWFTPPTQARRFTTVHDLVFRRFSETVDQYVRSTQEKRLQYLVNSNPPATLFVDSQATHKDVVDYYGVDAARVPVVYPGITVREQSDHTIRTVVQQYQLTQGKYCLAVGKREPRKNLDRLVDAFSRCKHRDYALVIVGPKGWQQNDETRPSFVRQIGFVDDDTLYALYQGAACFAMPSLYEGFGFPLGEALALGCPSLASRTSSLLEIGGSVVEYCDPVDSASITKGLDVLMGEGTSARRKRIEAGKKQVAQFTWEQTADKILSYFHESTS
ncbi:MAG: glycosyltransferase family 4 protein [Candidatus Roizmanbacteria bacterium]|nr:glycosyltransferase family 4 protein [Candidatus Roizmanbacteria bacterium]